MPGYTFEFTLKPSEIKSLKVNWRRRQSLYVRSINWVGAIVLGGALAGLASTQFVNPYGVVDIILGSVFACAAVVTVVSILYSDRFDDHRAVRRAKREGAEIFKPLTLALSPANLTHRTRLGSSELNWQAILELIEDDEAFYLFLDKNGALVLPHRVIREAGFEPADVLRDMRAWRATAPSSESRCPKCGYDLEGTAVQGCPECGWAREDHDVVS